MCFCVLTSISCNAYAQNKDYSPNVIINKTIKLQYEGEKDSANVFNAFKDCNCLIDTVNKKIIIAAGYADGYTNDYLSFNISLDLIANVSHRYWGDVIPIHADGSDPYPPFVIKQFKVQIDQNPFTNTRKGFLVKYLLANNLQSSSKAKSYKLTGYINCHHLKYYPIIYSRLP